MNSAASASRATTGKAKETEWRATLEAVEKSLRVERSIILAIWGMETSYGGLKDTWDVPARSPRSPT